MQHQLSQRFFFEAAHTLKRQYEADGSRRVHGHTYIAEVAVAGTPDPASGMLMDLAELRAAIEQVRGQLDHHMLDDVPGLPPATLENLCSFIWRALAPQFAGLASVTVRRDASGDSCTLRV
jgi:6-pyruvoyltetrahydropterin/6-carboxytetrahydropterin synthase